jgi:hypothetical protein
MNEEIEKEEALYGALDVRLGLHQRGHQFESDRKYYLTEHAYWLIGILSALFGALGYAWSNRVPNCLFLGLFGMACLAWFISLVHAIIVVVPWKYKATALTIKWDEHWKSLSEVYDVAKAERELCLDLINDCMRMEEINFRRNQFRETIWFVSNITTLVCLVLVALLIVGPHVAEYVREVTRLE